MRGITEKESMPAVLEARTVRDTALWKRLNGGEWGNSRDAELAQSLAVNANKLAETAVNRIKFFPYYHPQYTLHDETHLVRVCELMAIVAGDSLKLLNPVEVFLLIGAAFFHDQGMVPDADEWEEIKESSDFKVSLRRWEIDNPNLAELQRQMGDSRFSQEQQGPFRLKESELLDAHRTEYLRKSHGDRSESIVNRTYGNSEDLVVAGHNLAQILGRLCASHVWPAEQITDQAGFRVDEAVGTYSVNVRYLALLLRLADILDFDQDRTPESLLRAIHFSSTVSVAEWAKHRSVTGWEINPNRIRFTMQCEHPSYQRAAYEFMDWIDRELSEAHRIVADFPRSVLAHYVIPLPTRVDRTRIEPKNNAYRYAELEFVLSREEIVNLLMTDQLYQNDALFVRELLQNSLDALRYRQAIHGRGRPSWDEGAVHLNHFIDEHGFQVVRCTDNGIGMDEQVISNFLTNVGRSYYRSPQFEQQRIGFRNNGVDFDPCAKFGIGFMACFMFGERIKILTRRDYGPGRSYGPPLAVEINGLGGIITIRDGAHDQPVGTAVEVVGPRKPVFLDRWTDSVRLCEVIQGYALATEYPIYARTAIDGIEESCSVPVAPAIPPTALDAIDTKKKVLEKQFASINKNLNGSIRIGLLVGANGMPTLDNGDTKYEVVTKHGMRSDVVLLHQRKARAIPEQHTPYSPVCVDGILVAGQPGRGRDPYTMLAYRSCPVVSGDCFVLDIRGDLKPSLTPARVPLESAGRNRRGDASWNRIQYLVDVAHSQLWEEVTEFLGKGLCPNVYWKLCHLHRANVHLMSAKCIWEYVVLPVVESSGRANYRQLKDIQCVDFIAIRAEDGRLLEQCLVDGDVVRFDSELEKWGDACGELNRRLRELVLRFLEVAIVNGEVRFRIVPPEQLKITRIEESILSEPFGWLYTVPFAPSLRDVITVEYGLKIANRLHPLMEIVRGCHCGEMDELDDFNSFCASMVWGLSNPENLAQIVSGTVTGGRAFRRLGLLYKSLNWKDFDPKYAPPYKVWGKASGMVEITRDELLRWAELPSSRDDE